MSNEGVEYRITYRFSNDALYPISLALSAIPYALHAHAIPDALSSMRQAALSALALYANAPSLNHPNGYPASRIPGSPAAHLHCEQITEFHH